jgi:hypothetical protein
MAANGKKGQDVNMPSLVSKVPEGYREATAEEKLEIQQAGFRIRLADEQKARWQAERDLADSQIQHCLAEAASARAQMDGVRAKIGVTKEKDLLAFPDGTVCIKLPPPEEIEEAEVPVSPAEAVEPRK